ncbi:hypothetical protein K435DRAFT_804528 [Dendrothele bispora CBS 962.96]|uniref:Uncharacterized protein n=1 Tax=Dendrothele bispora (strain CBS 962.96) TaxID=1314807 RepID=A0A4S8LFE2_DENBC|nr:hypothetical protein K435DRAFT_804528 [Dendrothele bispora CBS 962.96]
MMLFLSLSSLAMGTEDMIIQIPLNGYNPPDSKEVIPLITGLKIGFNLMNRLNLLFGGLGIISTGIACESYIVNLPTGFFCISDQITVGASLDIGLVTKGLMKNYVDAAGNKTNTMILATPLIFTNFAATALIGFKAWHHFQSIQKNLGSTNGPNKALKILLLLIESGLLYLAFWIAYLVLGLTQETDTQIAIQAFVAIMPGLVAIYPILIILAVAHENNKPQSVNDMSLSQSIRFASIRASKSEDHHSESGEGPQLAFPAASINNSAEVEGAEIEVVHRLS